MMYFIQTLKDRNETLFYFGLICLAVTVLFFLLSRTTSTEVLGINAYIKPFKFALSTFLYSWTMAWFLGYLPTFNPTIFNWIIIITLGFEIFYIAVQASKGELSHYNVSTPTKSFLFSMMAIMATIATLATVYIAVLFFGTTVSELPNYYLWSIRLGLIIFVIFSFEGFIMGSKMAHTIGSDDGSKGWALLNWSFTYGDLRIAHFIGMHALQVIPLVSYYLLKNTKLTLLLGVLYFGLAAFTLIQALQAKPLLKM
ncbi:hypothetical protein [Flavobacterium sp. 25HG05S-40]|uniref:hypothetical protein n=1 Tax=Flavobacterium sp. 25HG05S-40 TaxID=3458682 RepID=UPI00404509AE